MTVSGSVLVWAQNFSKGTSQPLASVSVGDVLWGRPSVGALGAS